MVPTPLRTLLACAAVACLSLPFAADPASAEGFFDLYAGAAFPQDGPIHTRADDPTVNAAIAYPSDVDYEASPSVGLRGGYWFEGPARMLGVGLDLSYYRAYEDSNFAPLRVWAFPMTPLLMLRIPIASAPGFPGGRVQPYGAIGPGLTISGAHADLSELGAGVDDMRDVSFDVGLDVRGGLAVQLSRRFALFTEYRFTYLEPEYEDRDVESAFGPVDIDIEPELATHHWVFGVSFRF